jgi:phosphoribosylformylglycinamidine synthase subunit PurL
MVAAAQAGVPLAVVGRFGGDTVSLGGDGAPLAALSPSTARPSRRR